MSTILTQTIVPAQTLDALETKIKGLLAQMPSERQIAEMDRLQRAYQDFSSEHFTDDEIKKHIYLLWIERNSEVTP